MKREVTPIEEVEKQPQPQETKKEDEHDLSEYTRNLSKDLQEKIEKASNNGQPLQLVIYGSDSTSKEKGAWPVIVKEQLLATYGEDVFKVDVISEGDKTSLDVLHSKGYEEVSELNPDIVLFEAFTLKDNTGKISMKNRFDGFEKMIDEWKDANKDVTILVQPANPIYGATYYPDQVAELKEFAQDNKLIYLDHWENWPDVKDKEMNDYLTADGLPNKRGNEVWGEFLVEYFIGEK